MQRWIVEVESKAKRRPIVNTVANFLRAFQVNLVDDDGFYYLHNFYWEFLPDEKEPHKRAYIVLKNPIPEDVEYSASLVSRAVDEIRRLARAYRMRVKLL